MSDLVTQFIDVEALVVDFKSQLVEARLTYEEWLEIGLNGCSRGCGCALSEWPGLEWAFKNRTVFPLGEELCK